MTQLRGAFRRFRCLLMPQASLAGPAFAALAFVSVLPPLPEALLAFWTLGSPFWALAVSSSLAWRRLSSRLSLTMRRLLGSTGRGTSVPSAFLLVTPSTTTLRTDTSTSTILPDLPRWSPRRSLTSSPVMTVIERRLYLSRSSSERWLAICLRAWWWGALARARRCLRGCEEVVRLVNLEWDELFMVAP